MVSPVRAGRRNCRPESLSGMAFRRKKRAGRGLGGQRAGSRARQPTVHLVESFLAQCAKTSCGIYVDGLQAETDPKRVTCGRCRRTHMPCSCAECREARWNAYKMVLAALVVLAILGFRAHLKIGHGHTPVIRSAAHDH